jgi:hypothetical protein
MLRKFGISFFVKFSMWKQQHKTYQTVKHVCDDCGKKGLVLRQISILNLAFWLTLGILFMFVIKWCSGSWWLGGTLGFILWYGSTAINVTRIKPQCRHCRSENVRMPDSNEELKEVLSNIKEENPVAEAK